MSEPHVPNGIPHAWGIFQQTFILASRFFESVTGQFGLSYPQAAVLTVLRLRGRPLPLSHVARLLTQEAQSTTELADRLERRGLVRRTRDPRDRRLVLLELTPEGREVHARLQPGLSEGSEHVFAALNERDRARLAALLKPVRDRAADLLGGREKRRRLMDECSGAAAD